jgi:RNA polymerase sigma-70 factor (ECF subfamily)
VGVNLPIPLRRPLDGVGVAGDHAAPFRRIDCKVFPVGETIRGVNRKATAAFERIMDAHGKALGRVAECYAASGADSDDLAQEIGVAIWRALPRFRGECSERTFAMRIAHNRGLHFSFKRRKNAAAEEHEIADPRPGPEDEAGQNQRRERLLSALRELPVAYRQVLSLSLEEIDHGEIAEIVGISVGNVAVRLNRARAALRLAMEGMR